MKTIVTSLLPALLVIVLINIPFTGSSSFTPNTGNLPIADSDSVVTANKPLSHLQLTEEAYIDDIPFDTRKILCSYLNTVVIAQEPEPYSDDIPFETASIASRFIPAAEAGIIAEPEAYIDDIPFDTARIVSMIQQYNIRQMCSKAFWAKSIEEIVSGKQCSFVALSQWFGGLP